MTKQHSEATYEQDQPGRDKAGHQRSPASPNAQALLLAGGMDPKQIAHTIDAHPEAAHEIMALLQSRFGNGFTNQVLALVGGGSKEKAPMDATNFTIAPPNDLDVNAILAEMDGPSPASGLGEPRDVVEFDVVGEYQESRATIDNPVQTEDEAPAHAGKPKGTWVTRAAQFNRAHADDVTSFNAATANACLDPETGEVDPQKVARWQAEHGVKPDGRIGQQTVTAAIVNAV